MEQVLVVVEAIPRGTSAAELVAAPTVYLAARAVPAPFVASDAIQSVAQLQELDGLVLTAEVLPGEQLLRSHWRDPRDFTATSPTPDQAAIAEALGPEYDLPPGHEVEVLVLSPAQALGGNMRRGDNLNLIGTEIRPNGEASWVFFFDSVIVLAIESSLEPFDPEDGFPLEAPDSYTVTVALLPEEIAELAAAREESTAIRLTHRSEFPGEQIMVIKMSHAQALRGEVRRGDVVNVLASADPESVSSEATIVATDVNVVSVQTSVLALSESDEQGDYLVWVSLTIDELLAVSALGESTGFALALPS